MTEPADFLRPPPRQVPYGTPLGSPAPVPAGAGAGLGVGSAGPGGGAGLEGGAGGAPAGPPLAGPGWRLLARVIDGLIVAAIASPATVPLLLRYFRHLLKAIDAAAARRPPTTPQVSDATTVRLLATIAAISVTVSFLYEVPQLARWGQTLGKRVCRLRVVRRPAGGSAAPAPAPALGFRTAVLRWLVSGAAPNVPWVGGLFGVLDALWLLWDRPWRQCLHDKAAATVVVRLPRPAALSGPEGLSGPGGPR